MTIGITGQSGSGKTLVASLLDSYGFQVIDADIVSRKVVEIGKPALNELIDYFGNQIINIDGTLNRSELARIVFNSEDKKKKMEAIIFPHIIQEIEAQIVILKGCGVPVIFLDAPTLYESGVNQICDRVIAVIAPREMRRRRIVQRDQLTLEQAEARLSSQNDDDFYTSKADFTIENNALPNDLENKLLKIISALGLDEFIKRM